MSRKQNPQDIDVLTFIDAALYKHHEQAIRALGTEFRMGRAWVDTYPIQVFAEGHIYRDRYESDYIEWLYTWTHTNTRPRKQKGFIEILIG